MAHASEDANKSDAGFPTNLRSFGLSFISTGANWDGVPDNTRAGFTRVFKMESVKEVELEFAFGFPVALLVSLARLSTWRCRVWDWIPMKRFILYSHAILHWRVISQGRSPRNDQNSLKLSLKFCRCPAYITQVGVDANVRRRILRGSGGADHSVRVAPH